MFKDRRTNVHGEERNGRPSVVSDDLAQIVDQKSVNDGASQFQNIRVNFRKFHILFSTSSSQTRLSQVLRKMGSENVHGCAQKSENSVMKTGFHL
jgi:hypothetical protein